jgi:hypothetical protein
LIDWYLMPTFSNISATSWYIYILSEKGVFTT